MLDALARGTWCDAARARRVAAISCVMTVAVLGWLLATAHGTVDALGRPLGTDFSNVWSAGLLADRGQAALAWDWGVQRAAQVAIHRRADIPFYGWHYPPPFLLVAALLAKLPYVAALALWQLATLLPALRLVTRIVPGRDTWLVAAGAPVVMVCLGHGHNGFLTALLFGGGLLLLDRRPLAAGLLLGCLVYKPQFAVLLPLVLVAARQPRAIVGAALSVAALIGTTLLLWGWPAWQAFLDSLPLTRTVVIEQGSTGWEKIQTAFSAVRSLGGGVQAAYAVQGSVTAFALAAAGLLAWRASPPVRNAGVLAAALLCTPYALDYDFTLAGVAIAFLVADGRRRGFLAWEVTLLAAAWATPLVARGIAQATLVPLGLMSALALLTLAVRRAAVLDGAVVRPSPSRRSRAASAR
jgi:hypothetical protein